MLRNKSIIGVIVTIIVAIILVWWSFAERENCKANGGTVIENYGIGGGFMCIYENN